MLIPVFLKKERYLLYFLLFAILATASAAFIYLLFDRWIDHILKGYYFVSYDEFTVLLGYTSAFMALTTLLKLSGEWAVYLRNDRNKNIIQLKNLQAQLNPHFLLNSMQTIYSQAMNKSESTPDTVLQLSEILKYTLYETASDYVILSRELDVMGNYIEMYRKRMDPIRVSITYNVTGDPGNKKIIPLLFLPFIENSFKHGLQGTEGKAWVDISFQIEENDLIFRIENNAGSFDRKEKAVYKGIGIGNTRKRLEIMYSARHNLIIKDEKDRFSVFLRLKLENE